VLGRYFASPEAFSRCDVAPRRTTREMEKGPFQRRFVGSRCSGPVGRTKVRIWHMPAGSQRAGRGGIDRPERCPANGSFPRFPSRKRSFRFRPKIAHLTSRPFRLQRRASRLPERGHCRRKSLGLARARSRRAARAHILEPTRVYRGIAHVVSSSGGRAPAAGQRPRPGPPITRGPQGMHYHARARHLYRPAKGPAVNWPGCPIPRPRSAGRGPAKPRGRGAGAGRSRPGGSGS
jgi:hypothetical protein